MEEDCSNRCEFGLEGEGSRSGEAAAEGNLSISLDWWQ